MQMYNVSELMRIIKTVLNKEEQFFLSENISYFSSEGAIYPLKSKIDQRISVDTFIVAGSKYSSDLLKKLSTAFRPFVEEKMNILSKHYYYQSEIKEFYKHRDDNCLDNAIDACKKQIELASEMVEEFRSNKIMNEELIEQMERANEELKKSITGNDSISDMMREHYQNGINEINKLRNSKPINWEKYQGPVHTGYKQLCIIYEKMGLYKEAIDLAEQAKAQKWSDDWDKRIDKLKKKIKT